MRPALLIGVSAVVLLLAVACANVTNLLLARAVQRRSEFALRGALGAARSRLIRQVLTESLLLAVLGGAAGIVVAVLGVRVLLALSPPDLPRASAIAVDTAVLVFGLGVTTAIGFTVGLVPAVRAASVANAHMPQAMGRTTGRHRATRRVLVVAKISLALVLLVSSGLLWRSLERLSAGARLTRRLPARR